MHEEVKEANASQESVCFGAEIIHGSGVSAGDASPVGDDNLAYCNGVSEVAFAAFHAAVRDDNGGG